MRPSLLAPSVVSAILAGSWLGLLPTPALAFEPTGSAIADRYLELLEAGNAKVTKIESVEERGDNVRLSGITLQTPAPEEIAVEIAITELVNGAMGSDDRLRFSVLTMEGVKATSFKQDQASVANLSAENIVLPSLQQLQAFKKDTAAQTGKSRPGYWQLLFDSVELTDLNFTGPKGKAASLRRIRVEQSDFRDGMSLKSRIFFDDFHMEAPSFNPKTARQLSELGYDALTLSGRFVGTYDPDSGMAEISPFSVSVKDAVDLDLSLTLAGINKDILARLQSGARRDDSEEALKMLQAISLDRARIQLRNRGLYDRALDLQARKTGTDRSGVEMQMSLALPFLLARIADDELKTQIGDAITAFMTDPGSLVITSEPASPPSLALLLSASVLAPQSLPGLLNLSISANTAQ